MSEEIEKSRLCQNEVMIKEEWTYDDGFYVCDRYIDNQHESTIKHLMMPFHIFGKYDPWGETIKESEND